MIFSETLPQVLDGTKTQTRRPLGLGDYGHIIEDRFGEFDEIRSGSDIHHMRTKWKLGRTYAVQPGRSKRSVGRIRITKIRMEPVGRISQEDAVAEGFESVIDFLKTWQKLYPKGSINEAVVVLDFELVKGSIDVHQKL